MSRDGRYDKAIVCPFYRASDPYHVCCEGITKDSSIKVTFGNSDKTTMYKDCFCRNIDGYKRCKINEMLERKYVDDE